MRRNKIFKLGQTAKGGISYAVPAHVRDLEWSAGPRMSASDKEKFNYLADDFFIRRGLRPPWARKNWSVKKI
tara:strand:- start:2512 stop:2727 length:216 start_codon:yes stop_codon:yes gene_type:complete